jgi:dTDP-4-dehydrorhamnose 3,5-epimerase
MEQTDIFAFAGPGNFEIYLWDNREHSTSYRKRMKLSGGRDNPITLTVPPGIVHAYRNISKNEDGMVLNYPDRLYAGWGKSQPVDEVRHEESEDEFFQDFQL